MATRTITTKTKPQPQPVEILDDGCDDVDFLAQLDAVEAQAMALKRSRGGEREVDPVGFPEEEGEDEEGAYVAAMKGSKSVTWQKKKQRHGEEEEEKGDVGARVGGSGACFKCGKDGHWARDCVNSGGGGAGGGGGESEKACPCGVGSCVVFTANTERNRGRRFYRCPVRQENGGCGFFEWCDEPSRTTASPGVVPEKTWKSGGQPQVYQQPFNQGTAGSKSWNDYDKGTSVNSGYGAAQKFGSTDNKGSTMKSGSCFKCGEDGHWARDCPSSAVSASNPEKVKSSSNACYKCGQSGHWARDCSQGQTKNHQSW